MHDTFSFLVTKSAVKRLEQMFKDSKIMGDFLRIVVNSGGCSGLSYSYEITNLVKNDDAKVIIDDVCIVIDPVSQSFLKNCTLDYLESLGASFFQIINPNAATKCGCGKSFSV